MVIISTTFVVTLLALVAVAAVAGVSLLGVAAGRTLAVHHRTRVARHETVGHYWGHVAFSH